ncbi:12774_t:CDS:1, partial [Funneliformis caledonium]
TNIDEFITQGVVTKKALKRYLTGVNMDKLKRCGTMDRLETFVKEVFKICHNNYDIQAVKKLDYLTNSCKVPSRSGKNIASNIFL